MTSCLITIANTWLDFLIIFQLLCAENNKLQLQTMSNVWVIIKHNYK